MIRKERVRILNRARPAKGRFVAYWMQASQRAKGNHALEFAAGQANEIGKPLVVFFGITDRYPGANRRHYPFLLEGLRETKRSLAGRGIGMAVRNVPPAEGIVELARDACLIVCDRGYTRSQRAWRAEAAGRAACPVVEVESDAIVPVETASGKEEYGAATLRRKIRRLLPDFLVPLREIRVRKESVHFRFDRIFDVEDPEAALAALDFEEEVPMPVAGPLPGGRRLRSARWRPSSGTVSHGTPRSGTIRTPGPPPD